MTSLSSVRQAVEGSHTVYFVTLPDFMRGINEG